jgi:hypothetical protein
MHDSDQKEEKHLEWRDYVALTLALLQTILLPFLVTIAIFLVLLLVVR